MFTFSGDTAPLASNAIVPPPGICGVIPAVPTAASEMSPAVFGTFAGSTKFPSIVSKTIGSVGYLDLTARLWDVQTGQQTMQFLSQGKVDCIAFSPDGKRVASGGSGNQGGLG